MGIATLQQDVLLGAGDKECGGERQPIQPLEVEIPAIHHVKGAGLRRDRSRRFTSCTLPSVTQTNKGMLPCRSISVCSFTAPLRSRKRAHGNIARHRSMVVESSA